MKLARSERQTPARRSPWDEINRLHSEINRLFGAPFAEPSEFFEGFMPPADVLETKDSLVVKAELPGMQKQDINVSVEGNNLVISGERKEEKVDEEAEEYRCERYFGRIHRNIPLPHTVDQSKISATYRDGVLVVTLPKSEEAKRKQIEIKAE